MSSGDIGKVIRPRLFLPQVFCTKMHNVEFNLTRYLTCPREQFFYSSASDMVMVLRPSNTFMGYSQEHAIYSRLGHVTIFLVN